MERLNDVEAKRFSALVLTCADGRLHGPNNLVKWIPGLLGYDGRDGVVSYDLISVPGSCWKLARGSAMDRLGVLNDLALLIDRHQLETILVISHRNCARYGERDPLKEDGKLRGDLAYTRRLLRQSFPSVSVLQAIACVDEVSVTGVQLLKPGGEFQPPLLLCLRNDSV